MRQSSLKEQRLSCLEALRISGNPSIRSGVPVGWERENMDETAAPAIQITVASPKGGAGKTMTTILLAGEFAAGGYKVLVIDTDPQMSAKNWHDKSKGAGFPLKNIEVVCLTSPEDVAERLMARQDEDIVLIDVQGTATAALGTAVVHADFVVIPTRAHIFDVEQAIALVRHVKALGGRQRVIPYGVLLNAVNGIERNTMAFKTTMAVLKQSKVDVLDAFLSQRPTYAAVATAGTLYEVSPANKAIEEARDQTNYLAAEVIKRLNGSAPA